MSQEWSPEKIDSAILERAMSVDYVSGSGLAAAVLCSMDQSEREELLTSEQRKLAIDGVGHWSDLKLIIDEALGN